MKKKEFVRRPSVCQCGGGLKWSSALDGRGMSICSKCGKMVTYGKRRNEGYRNERTNQ